jgi:hypothetical protein
VSDVTKYYEERFSYDTNGRISYIQLKDDVSGKWIQRSYGFTTGGQLLLPTVITISAWTIV